MTDISSRIPASQGGPPRKGNMNHARLNYSALQNKLSSQDAASAEARKDMPQDGSAWVPISIHNADSAVDLASMQQIKRKMQGQYRAALLLRRRVGSLREDRDFDSILRQKSAHILVFSMIGLCVMLLTQLVTWMLQSTRTMNRDAYINDRNTPATLVNVMYISQAIISSSTIVSIGLISQKYRLIIMMKRAEWSGSNLFEVEALRGGASSNSLLRDRFENSYVFSRSPLRWRFLGEVLLHLPHPVIWMSTSQGLSTEPLVPPQIGFSPPNLEFKLLQLWMFVRVYLIPDIVHINSEAYISRFEVVNSNADLLNVSYRIEANLTLKMLFYEYTIRILLSAILFSILIFGFGMFTLERVEGTYAREADPGFGSYWNSVWFSYITFATVGYGEYFPNGNFGRVIAVLDLITGVSVFTLFGAVLVGQVALTKEQKHSVEYLATRSADESYRDASQNLIVSAFVKFIAPHCPKRLESAGDSVGHKSNRLHKSIKDFRNARRDLEGSFAQADDTVFASKMDAIDQLTEAVDRELGQAHGDLVKLEEKLQNRIRNILNRVAQLDRQGNIAV
jgi:hypothetical protein